MKKVADCMNRDLVTCRPTETAQEALTRMEEHSLRHLLVLEGKRLVGIVSNRDLIRVCLSNSGRILDLAGCRVVAIMTPTPLETIGADALVTGAAKRMVEAGVSALPVLEDDHLVGIVTHADLLMVLADSQS